MNKPLASKSASRPFITKELILMCATVLCLWLPQASVDNFGGRALPQKIIQQALLPGQDVKLPAQQPSLRGCCGYPTEFRWVFLDVAKEAIAGTPFRTRVFALDAQGRQARPSACGELRVDLGLSGGARLTQGTSPPAWHFAELELDIENEMAEAVNAEVRIESPNPASDVLLHTSQIHFASGPAHNFVIDIQLSSLDDKVRSKNSLQDATSSWPMHTSLDVVVFAQDRFGNRVSLLVAGFNGELVLRNNADAESLEMTPRSGTLQQGGAGEGRATIRGLKASVVKFWLEQVNGTASSKFRWPELKSRTATRAVSFTDPNDPNNSATQATISTKETSLSSADAKWAQQAEEVRKAVIHTWRGYRQYAWGHDELQPLSKKGKDTFGKIGMTIIDSLTTLWLMGLQSEFEEAANFVEKELDFNKANADISVFELTIRGLGGLLGAHALSGRQVFLNRARELGERLLPAFNSSSRIPWPKWNIARGTGRVSNEPTILAEAGSIQLEFRCLTEQTGDRRFRDAGDAAFKAIQSTGMTGLLPVYLTPPSLTPIRVQASKFAIGALADSYYEYLLKQWLQNPKEEHFKELWLRVMDELPGLARPKPPAPTASQGWLGAPPRQIKLVEVAPGGEPIWKMDHLSCFAPGMIVLGLRSLPQQDLVGGGRNRTKLWWQLAEGLATSCVELWSKMKSGLSPEFAFVRPNLPFDFREIPREGRHSFLRPETAESLFYLYHYTGDEKYRQQGEQLFQAIVAHAKVHAGFASVKDVNVVPTDKLDDLQSFVMAETFKYLYLLFSPADKLDLDQYVLNTEGHPLKKMKH